jgi:integrase
MLFQKLTERPGLPRIRFHDCRHSTASLMPASGEHPQVVQERLGHANISITLDR